MQYYLLHKKQVCVISAGLFHLWFNVYLEIITLRYEVIDQKFNTSFFDFSWFICNS